MICLTLTPCDLHTFSIGKIISFSFSFVKEKMLIFVFINIFLFYQLYDNIFERKLLVVFVIFVFLAIFIFFVCLTLGIIFEITRRVIGKWQFDIGCIVCGIEIRVFLIEAKMLLRYPILPSYGSQVFWLLSSSFCQL